MMNMIQKIIDDFGDGDIVNIQFIPFNEKQEKIEGPLKLGELNLVIGGRCTHIFLLNETKLTPWNVLCQ